jgi:helix-turn-helix protein/MarR family protein
MPGDRLTYEDRRTIAAGLAEGLGYTEIARRLSRPTSTVSREVARNGGPADYRADRAHRTTAWRAHRRTPRPTAGEADVPEFEAAFAAMMVRTGLSAAPARVLASLYTSDTGSYTSAELVRRLRISAASVSKAVGYLESLAMVRREREGRRDRYVIDDDAAYQAWLRSTRTIGMWAETARQGADLLGTDTPAGTRLRRTSRFFEVMRQDMMSAAEHYRSHNT